MPYPVLDIDVDDPFPTVALETGTEGVAVLVRRRGQPVAFWMEPLTGGDRPAELAPDYFRDRVGRHARAKLVSMSVREEIAPRATPALPPLTVAICTRDRPEWLARCLDSLQEAALPALSTPVEVIVVDNAPPDGQTREVVEARPGVRYVCEPRPGLNFARNHALREASGVIIAYLDDDVVVDRYWLQSLARAHAEHPDAGAFTGLVLPYELDTPAQILFEEKGGFRNAFESGFDAVRYGPELAVKPHYPVNAGLFGAGANMAFRRDVLDALGGFDEALDTGAPLPGGGDLDIFYRVVRASYPLVYEPSCLVFHQHRREIGQLHRQYWGWGLGFMAFVAKSYASDPEHRPAHRGAVQTWFRYQTRQLAGALRHRDWQRAAFVIAELRGGVTGLFGEYARSQRRIARIREAHP